MTTDAALTNGTLAWITRAGGALDVLNKFTLTTFLLVIFTLGLSVWFGWISSPLGSALADHGAILRALDHRAAMDVQFMAGVDTMSREMSRSSAAYRIRICSEIPSADLRRRCLDQ